MASKIIKPTNVVIIITSVILNNVFPLRLALRLRIRQKKTFLFTLGSVKVPRQTQNLETSEKSATASIIEAEHDTSQSTSKKILKRDSWSNNQTGALINAWKENFYEIERYRQPSAWLKVKAAVDNHGPKEPVK